MPVPSRWDELLHAAYRALEAMDAVLDHGLSSGRRTALEGAREELAEILNLIADIEKRWVTRRRRKDGDSV